MRAPPNLLADAVKFPKHVCGDFSLTILPELQALSRPQRAVFVASLLGWALDAFDFFLVVFVVRSIAADFHAQVADVAYAITLTLMFRPLGALIFGWLADRFGRRPVLMADILLYSGLELGAAFAPSLGWFLVLRALFGIAMGGEWGVGSSLVMESIPAGSRGVVSGILQQGYALGYLLAAVVYGLFFDLLGWRGMFVIGTLPALLVVYIRLGVQESPAWERRRARTGAAGILASVRGHWKLFLYVIALMTAFNFLAHGTQDLYPTLLQAQRKLSTHVVSAVAIMANLGAIAGGIFFGTLSQRLGRRRAIMAAAIFAVPMIPLWAYAVAPVWIACGAFLIQFGVQGAWGVVPAHLNELSPEAVRGTFPGLAYQLGNLIASSNAVFQAKAAAASGGNYALVLAVTAAITAAVLVVLTYRGPEAREAVL